MVAALEEYVKQRPQQRMDTVLMGWGLVMKRHKSMPLVKDGTLDARRLIGQHADLLVWTDDESSPAARGYRSRRRPRCWTLPLRPLPLPLLFLFGPGARASSRLSCPFL